MSTAPPSRPSTHVDVLADTIANAPRDTRPGTEEDERILDERQNDPNPRWVPGDEVSRKLAERIRRERG